MLLFGPDFKSELQKLMDMHSVKAIIMGNRLTDPYSANLNSIEPSSPGWPQFIRVFPILNWDYSTIWQFLRTFNLPYCSLYDQGFTSLGEVHNSQPNPMLALVDGKFRPAYELEDDSHERLSRK